MLKEKFNDMEKDYKAFKVKMASFVVEKPKPRVRKTIQLTDEEDNSTKKSKKGDFAEQIFQNIRK